MIQPFEKSADDKFLELGDKIANSSCTQPSVETRNPRQVCGPRNRSTRSSRNNGRVTGPLKWKERVYQHPPNKPKAGHMIGVDGVTPTFPLDHLVDISTALLGIASNDLCPDGRVHRKRPPTPEGDPNTTCVLYREDPLTVAPEAFQWMSSDTWQFLRFKDALAVPAVDLRRALMDAYISFVHPSMPVLDLPRVLDDMLMGEDEHHFSPLLFQAMMFAASAFVDAKSLQTAGYRFRSDLRRELFYKTKAIYESELEAESTIQIQALLLISDWHDGANAPKDPTYWISLAISTAHRLGLHKQAYDNLDSVRRRLWWCIYAQDIRTSLKLRRPRQLRDAIVGAGFLQDSDLEMGPVSDRVRAEFSNCVELFSPENALRLHRVHLHSINLCVRIGHVLDNFYTPSWTRNAFTESPVMLVPRRPFSVRMDLQAEHASDALSAAYDVFLSEGCLEHANRQAGVGSVGLSLAMQKAEFDITYHLAQCVLSHALLFPSRPIPSFPWKERLRRATDDLTSSLRSLCDSGPGAVFPSICVPAVSLITAAHVIDLDNPDESQGVKDRSLSNYQFAVDVSRILRETHPAAGMISMISMAPNSGHCWSFR